MAACHLNGSNDEKHELFFHGTIYYYVLFLKKIQMVKDFELLFTDFYLQMPHQNTVNTQTS